MKYALICLLALGGLLALGLVAADKQMEAKKLEKQGQVVDTGREIATTLGNAIADRVAFGRRNFRQPVKQAVYAEPTAKKPLIEERVDLPNVEGHFWLTFLYQENWQSDPETVRLHNMFATDPRLAAMRRRCRVNNFDRMDDEVAKGWEKYAGSNKPMIVLQSPDGKVVYKASKGNIPAAPDDMVSQIQTSLDEKFRKPCPCPKPVEPVAPPVEPVAPVDPLPDTVVDQPAPEAKQYDDPVWLAILLGVSGLVGGVLLGRKSR